MKIACVVRTFQAKKSINDFDLSLFQNKVVVPIKKALGLDSINGPIIIVTNGDKTSKHGEIEMDGKLPSEKYLEDVFHEEIEKEKIIIHRCVNWGNNPGSSIALNVGDNVAIHSGMDLVLHWSPEMDLENILLYKAINILAEKNLSVVGIARKYWWEKIQWKVPQNTISLWKLSSLMSVDGFSDECNNFGEITDNDIIEEARKFIGDETISRIPIAGMEDFHAMLKMMSVDPMFRWGTIKDKPLKWDVDFPKGSDRWKNHMIKVFRQGFVMSEYAKSIFPNINPKETLENFFIREYM